MKNFDQDWVDRESEEARTFTLRGQKFVRKTGIRPESMVGWDERLTDDAAVLERADKRILLCIEDKDDAHKRWLALRADEERPLGWREINEVFAWLLEGLTGRPTQAPSGSSPGREQSGTGSTDGTSLRAVEG